MGRREQTTAENYPWPLAEHCELPRTPEEFIMAELNDSPELTRARLPIEMSALYGITPFGKSFENLSVMYTNEKMEQRPTEAVPTILRMEAVYFSTGGLLALHALMRTLPRFTRIGLISARDFFNTTELKAAMAAEDEARVAVAKRYINVLVENEQARHDALPQSLSETIVDASCKLFEDQPSFNNVAYENAFINGFSFMAYTLQQPQNIRTLSL